MSDLRETVLDRVGIRKHGESHWEWIRKNPSAHQKQIANAYWITDTVIRAVIEALATEAEKWQLNVQEMHMGSDVALLADWLRGHLGDTEATDE